MGARKVLYKKLIGEKGGGKIGGRGGGKNRKGVKKGVLDYITTCTQGTLSFLRQYPMILESIERPINHYAKNKTIYIFLSQNTSTLFFNFIFHYYWHFKVFCSVVKKENSRTAHYKKKLFLGQAY